MVLRTNNQNRSPSDSIINLISAAGCTTLELRNNAISDAITLNIENSEIKNSVTRIKDKTFKQ